MCSMHNKLYQIEPWGLFYLFFYLTTHLKLVIRAHQFCFLNISILYHRHLGLWHLLCGPLQWPSSQHNSHWLAPPSKCFSNHVIPSPVLKPSIIAHNLQSKIQTAWPAGQGPSFINLVKTRGCDHLIYWCSPWHIVSVQLICSSVIILEPAPSYFSSSLLPPFDSLSLCSNHRSPCSPQTRHTSVPSHIQFPLPRMLIPSGETEFCEFTAS